jgi:hypothetical protein
MEGQLRLVIWKNNHGKSQGELARHCRKMDKAFSSISFTSSLTGGNALEVSDWVAPFSGEKQLRVAHLPVSRVGH